MLFEFVERFQMLYREASIRHFMCVCLLTLQSRLKLSGLLGGNTQNPHQEVAVSDNSRVIETGDDEKRIFAQHCAPVQTVVHRRVVTKCCKPTEAKVNDYKMRRLFDNDGKILNTIIYVRVGQRNCFMCRHSFLSRYAWENCNSIANLTYSLITSLTWSETVKRVQTTKTMSSTTASLISPWVLMLHCPAAALSLYSIMDKVLY